MLERMGILETRGIIRYGVTSDICMIERFLEASKIRHVLHETPRSPPLRESIGYERVGRSSSESLRERQLRHEDDHLPSVRLSRRLLQAQADLSQ